VAWTVSERLHCSIFHKKNDSALVPARLHLILAFFLERAENAEHLAKEMDDPEAKRDIRDIAEAYRRIEGKRHVSD
jgi:hypothetical protein